MMTASPTTRVIIFVTALLSLLSYKDANSFGITVIHTANNKLSFRFRNKLNDNSNSDNNIQNKYGGTSSTLVSKAAITTTTSSTTIFSSSSSSSSSREKEEMPSASASVCESTKKSKKTMKKNYTFTEARRVARGHGFSSLQEFLDYECAGAYQVPKNADQLYSSDGDGWKGWDDFLGIPYPFEEALTVARNLKLINQEEYMQKMKQRGGGRDKNKNDNNESDDDAPEARLPYRPDLYYKESWQGWDHFLSPEKMMEDCV